MLAWLLRQLCYLSLICASIVSVATVIAFADSWNWLADLACQFRCQYVVIFIVLAVILTTGKWRRSAVACCVFAVINLVVVSGAFIGARDSSPPDARFRILQINLNYKNFDYERVENYIRTVDPDLLVLEEYTPAWGKALSLNLAAQLPYKIGIEREDPYGIAVFSRHKIEKQEILNLAGYGWPSILCQFPFAHGSLNILAVHLIGPVTETGWTQQRNELSDLRETTLHIHPLCICGDFNRTPWTTNFQQLLTEEKLRDSRIGYGLQASWPTGRPIVVSKLLKVPFRLELAGLNLLVALPIDHCLVTKELRVVHREIGPFVGSDHFPVVVDLAKPSD
jgi:endonuclease/exonuclease/phosphatase (EEP) superfamily protein YafD